MKRDENDKELQRKIDEQEQALSELLTRVMERPLVPLHKTLDDLKGQLATVQQANAKAALSVEAGLSEVLEAQTKRINRHFGDVAGEFEYLKGALTDIASALDRYDARQIEHVEAIAGSLARADGMLAQLDTRASESLAAAARTAAKMDVDVNALREQQQMATNGLNKEFGNLTQQLERQEIQLSERIDAVQSGLAPSFSKLATTVDDAAKDVVRQYETLSETQKALISATVQEQLSLQLAPFRVRTNWLVAMCGLSFASTLILLGTQLFH